MNERIQELMIEAGIDVDKLRTYPGGWPREDLTIIEDFAKLIIRECIDNLAWHGHDEAVSQLEWLKVNRFGIK